MSGKDPLPRELAYQGVRAQNPPDIVSSVRNPNTHDKNYPLGTMWMNTVTQVSFQLVSSPGIWAILGGAMGGDLQTLTGSSGGALMPTLGNINILGNASTGITIPGAGSTLTVTAAAASTTQVGTVELATDMETIDGTDAVRAVTPAGLTARLGDPGPIGGDTASMADFTNVSIVATATTALQVIAAAASVAIDVVGAPATPAITVAAGDGYPGLHVTNGDILITSGDLFAGGDVSLTTAGKGLRIQGGAATDSIGTVTLNGVSGAATVLNTNIAATDKIFLSRKTLGSAAGFLSYAITPATSFTITSDTPSDDAEIDYLIIGQPIV